MPRGSRVLARDQQAIVITNLVTRRGARMFLLRSCARDSGKFRLLLSTFADYDGTMQNPKGPYRLRLAGRYVTYAGFWGYHGDPIHVFVTLVNLENGERVRSPGDPTGNLPSTLLLSSTGTATWLWTVGTYPNWTAEARALSAPAQQTVLLDSASSSSVFSTAPLADLQVYVCVPGCTSTSTLIAWTHSGTWRYATVT